MHCILCIVLHLLHYRYFIIFIVFYALYYMYCIICNESYAFYSILHFMHFIHCIIWVHLYKLYFCILFMHWNFKTCYWPTDRLTDSNCKVESCYRIYFFLNTYLYIKYTNLQTTPFLVKICP